MKNNCQHFIWSSIVLIFIAALGGCVKSGAGNSPNAYCYVSVMNEAPYSSAVDIYFSGTLVTAAGGVAPGKFSSEYASVKPGTYTVDFKVTGTDSILYELPAAPFDTSNFYTLILYNTAPGSSAVQATRILDNFTNISQTSAYYRFFNLNPDMPKVDLYLDGSVAQTSRTPADNVTNLLDDEFLAVNPQVYSIQVKSSTTDSVLATLPSTPLAAGSVYTIFLQGTAKSANLSVLPALY